MVHDALTNMMKPKREPLQVVLQLPLPLEGGPSREDEGKEMVIAVLLVPRAVRDPREEGPCSAGDRIDPLRDLVRAEQGTRSEGNIIVLEETSEQREARVKDTFKTSVTPEGANTDIRAPADIISVKVIARRLTNAITHMSRLPQNREGVNLIGNMLLTRSKPPIRATTWQLPSCEKECQGSSGHCNSHSDNQSDSMPC